jgi:hypothetical protein
MDLNVFIERFDDVTFGDENDIYKRVQLKHSVKTNKSLTDNSADLWKTIRIWSEGIFSKEIDPSASALLLITTAKAPQGSIAEGLGELGRNETQALAALNSIAASGGNVENTAGYDAFNDLTPRRKQQLVRAIHIYTGQGDIDEAKRQVIEELAWVTKTKFASALVERLEGWWINRVIDQLIGASSEPIHRDEIEAHVLDIAGQFEAENLSIDYILASPPEGVDPETDERTFVKQLRLIAVSNPRIANAILDYYRAVQQRSRWLSEDQLLFAELESYEDRLVDEWRRKFHEMIEDLQSPGTERRDDAVAGRTLYNWFQNQAEIRIRPRCREPYVQRGTFHILAGDESDGPRVGWHPEFLSRLRSLVSKAVQE